MDNFHKLIEGFHNFKQTYFLKERQYFESLEKAQNPKTLVVACWLLPAAIRESIQPFFCIANPVTCL